MTRGGVIAAGVGAIVGLLTCAAFAEVRSHDPRWVAPPEPAHRANPLAGRTDVVAGGAKVFQERCTQCHGASGEGSEQAPDLTQPSVHAQTDGALFWKISSGNAHAGMPPFSFLPSAQRWQIVLYLRTLSAK